MILMKAIYIWKDPSKNLDLNLMTPICTELAAELGWKKWTIFSDGWSSEHDWEELTGYLESKHLSEVIFHSIEQFRNHTGSSTPINPQILSEFTKANIPAHIAQARYLGPIVNAAGVKRVKDLIAAGDYYKSINSEAIRQGMLKKKGGRAPFGTQFDSNGTLQPDENYHIVEGIMALHHQGISTGEIAKRYLQTGAIVMTYQRVRGIIEYWKARPMLSSSTV